MNRVRVALAAIYLGLCMALGGASAAGAAGNGLLQVLAILIILIHVWSRGAPAMPREGRLIVGLFALFALAGLASLIALPASTWSDLPGRDVVVRSLGYLGISPLPAMPLSLDARRTTASLLALLPPAAMFLVASRLTRDERYALVKLLVAAAIACVLLGALQLFGGPSSRLRFYDITIKDRAVGFFANPNHMATLLLMSLPFAVLLTAQMGKSSNRSRGAGRNFLYAGIAFFIAVGIAINGSLAGYALLVPVALGSLLLYLRASGRSVGPRIYLAAAAGASLFIAASLVGPWSGERLGNKFQNSDVSRRVSVPLSIEIARDFLPVGSGLGTFRDLYRTYERPKFVSLVYVNHVHNDFVELVLELGFVGILLIAGTLFWVLRQGFLAWRGNFNGAGLARAASVALGAALLHSLVDYPLRTAAIAAVAALCAAYMIQPPLARRSAGAGQRTTSGARHLSAD